MKYVINGAILSSASMGPWGTL